MCGVVDDIFSNFENVLGIVSTVASFVPGPWQIPAIAYNTMTNLANENYLGAGLSALGGLGKVGAFGDLGATTGGGDLFSGMDLPNAGESLSSLGSGMAGGMSTFGDMASSGSGLGDLFSGMSLPNVGMGSAMTAGDAFNMFPEAMQGFNGAVTGGGLGSASLGALGGALGAAGDASQVPGGVGVPGDFGELTARPGMSLGDTLGADGSFTPGTNLTTTLQEMFQQAQDAANNPYVKLGTGLVKGLGSYMDYRGAREAQNNALDQLSRLDQLYSPDSAYAKEMEKTIARRDAARGRRSQYGPRAQELAANLTQNKANVWSSPQYMNLSQIAHQKATPWGSVFAAAPSIISGLGGLFR